jgi:ech hydrogenase subunit A
MDHGMLLALTVVLPVAAGLICLVANDGLIRRLVVAVTTVALIASSLLLYSGGGFVYEPAPVFETIILVLDFVLLVYFLYAGFRFGNLLVIGLTLLQLLPIAYFEFVMGRVEVDHVLMVDNLSLLMSLIISIVGSLVVVYSLAYMDEHEEHLHLERSRQNRFFFFMLLLLGAMQGLVFSNSLYWLYFFWEMTTLCSYELIRHDGTEVAVRNAVTALWMNLLGGVAFVGAMYVGHYYVGGISLAELLGHSQTPALLLLFATLAFAAFTKSAQFPFNKWLQGAMVAPTPVSALLHSSTMVNAGVYLVLRIAPAIQGTSLSLGIALVGAFTFMITAVLALNERVSKGILAYSTIGNLGLIFMCAGLNSPLGYAAAVTILVFHSVSKGLLFLGAGVVENRVHSRLIEDWEGLLARLPFTSLMMIMGMISMFLPPFGMLIGKWAAIDAITTSPLLSGLLIIMLVLVGSAATTVYYTKWLGHLTVLPQAERTRKGEELPAAYAVSMLSLFCLILVMSSGVGLVVNGLVLPAMPADYWGGFYAGLLSLETFVGSFITYPYWIAAGLILLMGLLIARRKGGVVKPPYLSGENVPDNPVAFRTTADGEATADVSGMFLDHEVSSPQLLRMGTIIGVLVVLIMFLTVVL